MIVRTQSATIFGPEGVVVEIEASLQKSLPAVVITGLPGDIVKESRERIRACLAGMGFEVPSSRLVVHLSPATAKKQGSQLDLGIAIAWLAAENLFQPKRPLRRMGFLGELSMDGRIRGVQGALALGQALDRMPELTWLFLPRENAQEAALLRSEKVQLVESLEQVLAVLEEKAPPPAAGAYPFVPALPSGDGALDRVRGQRLAKRALQVALAGRHHLLLIGPPGVGKSLLAKAAPTLLPPLTEREFIEIVKNQGYFDRGDPRCGARPFRSPHHSVSAAGLLGGGSGAILGGEVTLAHTGILFLDELPEFRKDALEGLREPMQEGEIHLQRVGARFTLPARFLLIGAMNPCPCGYDGDPRRRCECPTAQARAYRRRVSGPLYDRFDISVFLAPPTGLTETVGVSHGEMRESIERARAVQHERFGAENLNADATIEALEGAFALDSAARDWLDALCARQYLSFRGLHKTIRVARTIADLAAQSAIDLDHLREAWELRCRDLVSMR